MVFQVQTRKSKYWSLMGIQTDFDKVWSYPNYFETTEDKGDLQEKK